MKGNELHTAFLEKQFGPVRLHIIKQEHEWRMVHLYDAGQISRTMAIVRFNNYAHPLIRESHARITSGELLGITLVDADIPFKKLAVSRVAITLPDWLERDFRAKDTTTLAFYSHINVLDSDSNEYFLYAELIEIIPPEIINLIPVTNKTVTKLNSKMISLLSYADIETAPIEPDL